MKINICGLLAGLATVSFALTGCTNSGEPDPASSPGTSTATTHVISETADGSPFEEHKTFIGAFAEPSEIISQVEGNGSVDLPVGDLPAKFDSVGFMVSCTGSAEWEIEYSNGSSIGGSSCGDDSTGSAASVSLHLTQMKEEAVRLDIKEGTKVWATVFATNEPGSSDN